MLRNCWPIIVLLKCFHYTSCVWVDLNRDWNTLWMHAKFNTGPKSYFACQIRWRICVQLKSKAQTAHLSLSQHWGQHFEKKFVKLGLKLFKCDACLCVFAHQYDPELSSRQYGVELSRLTSEERAVPQLVEKLINYIEMHGLYTEGIYRKSGSTNKIKELRQGLDTGET